MVAEGRLQSGSGPFRLMLFVVAGGIAVLAAITGPFSTNDGPVHMMFAHFVAEHGNPAQVLQNRVFTLNLWPEPNWLVYLVSAALMKILAPNAVEIIVQTLCLVLPALFAWLVLSRVNPDNACLAFFVFPITLNQLFFYGLYNYCFSLAAFFLVLWAYFRLREEPSASRWAILFATFITAYLAHACGFLMACLAVTILSSAELLAKRSIGSVRQLMRLPFLAITAMVPAATLLVATSFRHTASRTEYAIPISDRIKALVFLEPLWFNRRALSAGPLHIRREIIWSLALALSITLLSAAGRASFATIRSWTSLPLRHRSPRLGLMVLFYVSLMVAFLVPDSAGGGWGHYQRAAIFVFFAALLCAGTGYYSRTAKRIGSAFACGTTVLLLAAAISIQWSVNRQKEPLAAIDTIVGTHCTVLPIIFDPRVLAANGNGVEIGYQPFYHIANSLELNKDRVVLFNFLARLTVYPVSFRKGMDPQELIFHWPPETRETSITTADIRKYEHDKGISIDYVLLRGKPGKEHAAMWLALSRTLQDEYFRQFDWPLAEMSLYRRWSTSATCNEAENQIFRTQR